jgi:outer membrane protein OmpA-like peptidoglycan-associated protein
MARRLLGTGGGAPWWAGTVALAAVGLLGACGSGGSLGGGTPSAAKPASTARAATPARAASTAAAGTTLPVPATEEPLATRAAGGPASASSASPADEPELPAGATPGYDDLDDDGHPDPFCGQQDFGGGLVLQIPCGISTNHTPEEGTTLVPESLYLLPSAPELPELSGVSVEAIQGRDPSGKLVIIEIFNTDALFAENSSVLHQGTDFADATVALVNRHFPGATVQVRGHADSRGSVASNQVLSDRRAARVATYLQEHGIKASVSAIGFGSMRPLVEERNPNGTENPAGERFDRRVEIAIRA